ncbi:bifunctional [glutamate--ammonia ligase]-adenylyl-L-tyrosine phosphorylase/[glutamate--ammonia-ligase] adenylyltransferase [Francisellaceae bacterium]|nr:bifunctional [glutamate--ammonia ligase]-adenylyl-L-tyrosine phosphorylase/[glutamate--ammonia-ligase] adenylyltransferase [Francisellaceae bacterium]
MTPIESEAQRYYDQYQQAITANNLSLPEYSNFKKHAKKVFSASPFVAKFAIKEPTYFNQLFSSGDIESLDNEYHSSIAFKLEKILNNVLSEEERDKQLRLFRQYETVRLVWQQALGFGDFERHSDDVSYLATSLIRLTLRDCHNRLIQERGIIDKLPELMVIGMGKLGGKELNFSSDIDLVFIYDADGEVENKRGRSYPKQMLYTQIGQKLINALHKVTVDGFVYRVDMRLRPFGDGSPLTCSIKSFEDYSLKHAREWERYAFVKGRILTGTLTETSKLQNVIRDFVYRKYIDYKMPAAIRGMKKMIMAEMEKKQMVDHIKLGRGGIREIEFLVQCYQLIYGGHFKNLRSRTFKLPLFTLQQCGYLSHQDVDTLFKCYVFLRNYENAIQMQNDEQKHCAPVHEIEQARQCVLLQYDSWETLQNDLNITREKVAKIFDRATHFGRLLKKEKSLETNGSNEEDKPSCTNKEELNLRQEINKFTDVVKTKKRITDEAKNLIFEILPLIEDSISNHKHESTFAEIFNEIKIFLLKIARRPAYLYLLLDNQDDLLPRFIYVFTFSAWFRQQLLDHPSLLEYTFNINKSHFNPNESYDPKTLEFYETRLHFMLSQSQTEDKEKLLEILNLFKLVHTYRIALLIIKKDLNIMQSSDALTFLAECIIAAVLEYSWEETLPKYPKLTSSEIAELKNSLGIVGYGKLGGHELSLTSDLDLIFLYNKTQLENDSQIFVRVAQQFISNMHTQSYSGSLYEVDVRLRPEGNAGLLVSSLEAYENYQHSKAWLWEHQAIMRARYISGGKIVRNKFEHIRTEILTTKRVANDVISEVIEMRAKMQENLLKAYGDRYDLKQSTGGIVDIEFLAQMFVLAYGSIDIELCLYTDNIRIFQILAATGHISVEDSKTLIDAYCYYRNKQHQAVLDGGDKIVKIVEINEFPEMVTRIWNKYMTKS